MTDPIRRVVIFDVFLDDLIAALALDHYRRALKFRQSTPAAGYRMTDLPDIPSPCRGICDLDPASRSCLGCLRTTREIARWPYADNAEKFQIIEALRLRRRAMGITSEADQRPRRRNRSAASIS